MRPLLCISGLVLALLWTASCRKDFDYAPGTGQLQFSKDTVFLDTVFSNIGSATYTLKVYNRGGQDIRIPQIGLEGGDSSRYRLNVDGRAGNSFEDVPLLAGDSLYIFIETTFDIRPLNQNTFLYTDAILFDSGPREQKVPLLTLVRDAVFLYPARQADGRRETLVLGKDAQGNDLEVPGFELPDSLLVLTDEKPYVIYGYAGVAQGKTLEIQAGARLYFHQGSGLFVDAGARLTVAGELSEDPGALEREVVMEGDRLEAAYSDTPGQWDGLWLSSGSNGHAVEYLTIKNAIRGIFLEGNPGSGTPVLHMRNSRIYNSALVNLWTRNTYVLGENLVLGNAGVASLLCENGGRYSFRHCTLANYWSEGGRSGPTLLLDNTADGAGFQASDFTSCLITGNAAQELGILGEEGGLSYLFSHCLIRYEGGGGPGPGFTDGEKFIQVLLNAAPGFINPARQDFRIGPSSQVLGLANPDTALLLPLDLLGTDRTSEPDMGAYQHLASESP